MQYHFELKLNQFHSVDKVFTSTDIAVFLNKAQEDLLNDRYSKKDGQRNQFFESDEKNRSEIGSLIRNHTVNTGSFVTSGMQLHKNAVFASLPPDYLYSLQEMCVVGYVDCNDDNVTGDAKVLPIRHDEYAANIDNPYGKPYKKLVWRMDYGATGTKRHELIHADDQYIQSYVLRYIKKPTAINIITGADCELNDILHEEIVDRAVIIALATIPQKSNINQKQTE